MKKINVALLSFGMSGRVFHAPFINIHPHLNLSGAWERSKKNISDIYPEAQSFDSLEAILENKDIDLVVVNTPTYTHYDYCKQSLLAGKHVVVEKAFTTTVTEARELKTLADRKNLKLAVYQNRRWDSDFLSVKNILDQKILGDIIEAEFRFERFNPNLSPKVHKETDNGGGGLLKDLGPHLIDQALVAFGKPDAVFADLRITREGSRVDDYFDLLLYYSKTRVRLKAGYFVREAGPAFIIHGTTGSFIKKRADTQEASLVAGISPADDAYGFELPGSEGILLVSNGKEFDRTAVPSPRGNYNIFYQQMSDAITSGSQEPVAASDGILVMEVIESALRSAATSCRADI